MNRSSCLPFQPVVLVGLVALALPALAGRALPTTLADPAPVVAAPASVPTSLAIHAERVAIDAPEHAGVPQHVFQKGVPADMQTVKTFGKAVVLRDALKMLVPEGWRSYAAGPVDLTATVSWKANGNWVSTLNQVLADAGTNAVIDWNQREVTLMRDGGEPVVRAGAASKPGEALAAGPSIWNLDPALSLSENLSLWATAAGWKLNWAVPKDYRVEARVTLTGSFAGEDGVLNRVVRAYANAEYPLAVDEYADHLPMPVIDIKAKAFRN